MNRLIGKIVNAEITKSMLGRESYGIFTVYLNLSFGNFSQSFGGYTLSPSTADSDIVYAYGINFILKILDTLEVESWEYLRGTLIRVDRVGSEIHGIGHYLKNNWFYPEELAKEMFPEKEQDVT